VGGGGGGKFSVATQKKKKKQGHKQTFPIFKKFSFTIPQKYLEGENYNEKQY
jgi:hypothetical protein